MRINDKENYENIRSKITMKNLKSIIENNGYSVVKVAMNSKISDSTVNAYINGQKIPSVPTLISMGDYLNCNLDYLLDRTNNPIHVNDLNKINTDKELSELIQIISSLPKEKRQLVIVYVRGILNS